MEEAFAYRQLIDKCNLTQEELAQVIFVSRTAISKWESGRGLPNIESLKAISKFFSVSLDELLSGEEILTIAENDHKQKENIFPKRKLPHQEPPKVKQPLKFQTYSMITPYQ